MRASISWSTTREWTGVADKEEDAVKAVTPTLAVEGEVMLALALIRAAGSLVPPAT